MARSRAYRRLPLAEKQLRAVQEMREPGVRCPGCDTQTPPADLLAHLELRCPGSGQPHARSRWISWREAMELGIPRVTMNRWIRGGLVRTRTMPIPQRQYLLRDLVTRLAERRARRR